MKKIVIMPGGFHPFHAGHAALYQSAVDAFPDAEVYVAATNDTKTRPFPFSIKEKLAKLAGVAPGHFVQVKSPFKSEEITSHYNPNEDVLIFVRSEKDRTEQPKPGGTKKDGTPAYFQPYTGKNLQPFSKHAYIAYLPTVEFGPGIKSATEIRNAWPKLDDRRKTAMVMSLYPATQKNPKLASNVVKMLDMGMGNQVDEGAEEALQYATQAHAGQTRSGGDPYITHPMRVADHIKQYKKSHNLDALISAAYLHDTIEDTDTTHEALHDLFGGLVASLVKELTSDPEEIKKVGKAQYLAHKMAAMSSYALVIKLADRLDNVKDITTARTPEWRQKYKNETEHILNYIEKTRALSGTHQKLIELIRAKLSELDNPEPKVDEARTNPEQNVKLESGMKELEAIADTISDPENWAVSMTSEPKLGINPQVGISEDTPKGVYFYPLNYVLGKIHSRKPLPWGNDYPYIQLFQYDRSGEMTRETKVDPAKLKQALSQYCSDEVIQQAIDDPEYDGTPYWFIYDCLSRLGKGDETNIIRWNKVLRDLGFTSVFDPGNGWIAENEPTQGVVLDPRIIKQHKTIANRKESNVVTPALIAKSLFDEIDMELTSNRIWQKYDPDGSKLRQAVKKYAIDPEFKPYIGKTYSQELEDKIKGYRLYGARQLSDVAMAWYKEQQPVKESDDPWGPQGNFAGDTPVNIGGSFTRPKLKVGDMVRVNAGHYKGIGEIAEIKADRARVWMDNYGRSFIFDLSDIIKYIPESIDYLEEK